MANGVAAVRCAECGVTASALVETCAGCGKPFAVRSQVLRPAHWRIIGAMWALYLMVPFLSLVPLLPKTTGLPLAMACSTASFGVAVWLLFQRSAADMLNAGAKLLLDGAATLALMLMITRAGTVAAIWPAM